MPFLGTLINFAAVLIFGVLGTLVKRGIPQRISDAIMSNSSGAAHKNSGTIQSNTSLPVLTIR